LRNVLWLDFDFGGLVFGYGFLFIGGKERLRVGARLLLCVVLWAVFSGAQTIDAGTQAPRRRAGASIVS